ncbi:MAG: heavy-metal-associated domain-containing protein [Flavobacterium sp.]|nr:heavy-metal-associated domain-containing protein [Pedobacter sp.]
MDTISFKTNIKCNGCLATITPFLNKTAGENNWKVDLNDPERILTVESNSSANEIIASITEAGFKAEKI